MESEGGSAPYIPWYRKSKDVQPFVLFSTLHFNEAEFHCTACFPWTPRSPTILWDGHAAQVPSLVSQWEAVAKKWMGTIAVGATGRLLIFPKLGNAKPLEVSLSSEPDAQVQNVAWILSNNTPLEPLVVFTTSSVITIFNVATRSVVGRLRGHGGLITSLSVHPIQPHLFCTTSRDFTTRIYDVTLQPIQVPNNPPWPPLSQPSLAGPAHGLHMCEPEGEGIGQCVAVLVGGRSGGHKGGVLCSAFHPSLPLIATGGVDRAVKIWRIPHSVFSPPPQPRIAREDKPLFSTDLLHKARIQSVNWLADDILVSHSAPALMRHDPEDVEDTYYEEGAVAVWQWLSLNRFFPPGKIPQKAMRGTASDYRNSESFKILSAYHLPTGASRLHVFRSLTHDPILLIPMGRIIRVYNLSQFGPRTPPQFPVDDLASLTSQMHLGGEEPRQGDSGQSSNHNFARGRRDGDGVQEGSTQGTHTAAITHAPLAALFDAVEGWDVSSMRQGEGLPGLPDIAACEVGFGGRIIVGVGKGTLFVWRLEE
ncbi:WD40-repeat-containing domain protein [Cubamyces lactineus]|nr:WD40-repeat-containing domain protein [Cubamyces lactineus]